MYKDKTKRKFNQTKVDVPATHFEYNTGKLVITVTSKHVYHTDIWTMFCPELNISDKESGGIDSDVDIICKKATDIAKEKLIQMFNSIKL